MKRYLAFDGSSETLRAIVYDEELHILGDCSSGETNLNFCSQELALRHIREAIDGALHQAGTAAIEEADGTLGHLRYAMVEELERILPICRIEFLDESLSGLLAGCFQTSGCVVNAASGSSIRWVENGKSRASLGGYGAYLGDEGGGYYIGYLGIKAALQHLDGWGPATCLSEQLCTYAHAANTQEITRFFYDLHDRRTTYRKITDFAVCVGQACDAQDKAAVQIVRKAGELLARQTVALYKREHLGAKVPVVLCGRSWNISSMMEQAFRCLFSVAYPTVSVHPALFDRVVGGVVYRLQRDGEWETKRQALFENFGTR